MKNLLNLRVLAIAVAVIVALYFVLVETATNFYEARRPEVALTFDSRNNFALSRIARAALADNQQQSLTFDLAMRYAKDAVRAAPRDADSLAVLGFAADAGRINTDGFPLVERAQSYSKRSLIAQIYLIEYWAKKGEAQKALHYYDLALTTQPASQRLLLPKLYQAMGARQGVVEVAKMLHKDPVWKRDFWIGLSDERPLPPQAVELYQEVHNDQAAMVPGIGSRMIRGLASGRQFASAVKIAELSDHKDSLVQGPRRINDYLKSEPAAPLDWDYQTSGSHSADPGAQEMFLSVRGAKQVIFANRLLELPPGQDYAVSVELRSDGGSGEISIGLRCADNDVALRATSGTVRNGETIQLSIDKVSIPEDCPYQWVTVGGRSEGMRSADLALADFQIGNARQ